MSQCSQSASHLRHAVPSVCDSAARVPLTCAMPSRQCVTVQPECLSQFFWTMALQIFVDVALGMSFLHSQSKPLVHGELKSPNILFGNNWQCKVRSSDGSLTAL